MRAVFVLAGGLAGAFLGWSSVRERREQRGELARLQRQLDLATCHCRACTRKLAHDLRNPLTTIRARAELMRRGFADRPADLKQLDAVVRSADRLEKLIALLGEACRPDPDGCGPEGAAPVA